MSIKAQIYYYRFLKLFGYSSFKFNLKVVRTLDNQIIEFGQNINKNDLYKSIKNMERINWCLSNFDFILMERQKHDYQNWLKHLKNRINNELVKG